MSTDPSTDPVAAPEPSVDEIVGAQIDAAPITAEDLAQWPLATALPHGGEWYLLHYGTERSGGRLIVARTRKALLHQWGNIARANCYPREVDYITLRAALRVEVVAPPRETREAYARNRRRYDADNFWGTLAFAAEHVRVDGGMDRPGLSLCPSANDADAWHTDCPTCRYEVVPDEHVGEPATAWASAFYLARRHHPARKILSGHAERPTQGVPYRTWSTDAREAREDELSRVCLARLEAGPHRSGVELVEAPASSCGTFDALFYYLPLERLDHEPLESFFAGRQRAHENSHAAAFARQRELDLAAETIRRAREAEALFAVLANTTNTTNAERL